MHRRSPWRPYKEALEDLSDGQCGSPSNRFRRGVLWTLAAVAAGVVAFVVLVAFQ